MQHLEVSGVERPIYGSLGVKRLVVLMSVIQFSDNKNKNGSQNIGSLAVQPPDVAANPESFLEFGCFESFMLCITS